MKRYAGRVVSLSVTVALVALVVVVFGLALAPGRGAALVWVSATVPAAPAYRWPLDGVPRVVRPFDPPPRPWLPGHRGVDLAATPGVTVYAAGPGTVRFAGVIAGRGVVSVEHQGGLRTTYEPVVPAVRAGERVAAGDPIGRLTAGHPGCAEAACLHWGLRRGDQYLDPLALLSLGRVRLLPLGGSPDVRPLAAVAAASGPGVGLPVRRAQPVERDVCVDLRGRERGVT
ncbi:MAG TPA: M23 family metallopeptidase [Micromonosporaceae bacterium]|jgi:murein DD-endopeptidase MepM/ murein hydrolase activator NlpD